MSPRIFGSHLGYFWLLSWNSGLIFNVLTNVGPETPNKGIQGQIYTSIIAKIQDPTSYQHN
jgi:hypothetical protein